MFAHNALNAIARVYPSLALSHRRSGEAQFLAGLESGQRLQATVQATLAGDEFVVSLQMPRAGSAQTLHMKLPEGIRSGDVLTLVFLSREPRPTFALMGGAPPAQTSLLLSETGRFINNLLRGPVFSGGPAALPGAVSSPASSYLPLLAAPPGDGAELAQNLARVLGRSGLFYEAHQAKWIAGAKPLAELLLEPQARLSSLPSPASVSAGLAAADTGQGAAVPAHDTTADAYDPVHPGALALVRQQLEVFEARHVAWQGTAWPGQSIAWEVAEEKPRFTEAPGAAGQSSAVWRTRLCLTLPNLGQVTASLRLDARSGCSLDLRLTAAEPVTAAALRAGAIPLANGMASAGIRLLGMGVDLDEEA